MQVTGDSDVIERATFDPKVAIENIDIEHINIGHPVVKRLFENVKNTLFDLKSDDYVRYWATSTLVSAFSEFPDKQQAWKDI